MERLTEKHYLATDHYMRCSEFCNVDMDCIDCPAFDRLVERLAAYEDTGLTPEQCAEYAKADREGRYIVLRDAEQEGAKRLRELAEADKEGRVAVLPCKVGGSMLNMIDIERPRIMKGLHFAVAYESVRGTIFYMPYDLFREYIDAGYVYPLHKLKEGQNGKSKLD